MADAKKKEPKLKLRTSYPAGMVTGAKAKGLGVITVSIEFPNGDREERQTHSRPPRVPIPGDSPEGPLLAGRGPSLFFSRFYLPFRGSGVL